VKRFTWRLQRVLDITEQREGVLRQELLVLAHRIIAVRQEILLRQASVRGLLDDLGRRVFAERLPRQLVVMACAAAEERLLERLRVRQAAASRAVRQDRSVPARPRHAPDARAVTGGGPAEIPPRDGPAGTDATGRDVPHQFRPEVPTLGGENPGLAAGRGGAPRLCCETVQEIGAGRRGAGRRRSWARGCC
jgi:hypothetical protein